MLRGILYKKFFDYKDNTSSDRLPSATTEYRYTSENILTQYVRHNDNKFDCNNAGIACRKHIIANRIRYISKRTNNIDETQITGIEEDDYLE